MSTAVLDPTRHAEASVELLFLAQSGDEEALNRLLGRYLPRLTRWARARYPSQLRTMVGSGDLAQDAVIAALPRLRSLEVRSEGALWHFLTKSVRNRIIDLHRRGARRPKRGDMPENKTAPGRDALGLAIAAEAFALYERALALLNPEDRRAVVLRLELGLSYKEVAAELDKPTPDAARMTVSRATERLADGIKQLQGGH